MTLLSRFTTLVKADAHGVVDAVEDRALLLKQHLRDAEAEIARKRAALEALDAEAKSLDETRKRLAADGKRLDEDVALALSGDKEELARFALRKLLAAKRRGEEAKRRLDRLVEARESLAATLAAQQEAFEELQLKVKSFLARAKTDEAERSDDAFVPEPAVAEEEVELELLRRRGGT